jgi:hypothetical protein
MVEPIPRVVNLENACIIIEFIGFIHSLDPPYGSALLGVLNFPAWLTNQMQV